MEMTAAQQLSICFSPDDAMGLLFFFFSFFLMITIYLSTGTQDRTVLLCKHTVTASVSR